MPTCQLLGAPDNGKVDCFLLDDVCIFSCNTGYELTGSDNRTCQSNGSWSGSEAVCGRGKLSVSFKFIGGGKGGLGG